MNQKLNELISLIENANNQYRIGKPIMSDKEYDSLLDELNLLDPTNSIFNTIGFQVSDDRKSKLPIIMASMNKEKSVIDILKWAKLKSINLNSEVILTPKYDGLSLCVDEKNQFCWTRGDGTYGQKSNEHYKLIENKLQNNEIFKFTYGEVIMPKKVFLEKYSDEFANPRNLVAGLLNSKEPSESLQDCLYIKYGGITDLKLTTKKEILDHLNENQTIKVQYEVVKISELNEELLISLFKNWSQEFEIDGIIVEVNSLSEQIKLGRDDSSNNPQYALAFKSEAFEQSAETEIIQIDWTISKGGFLKPVARLKPVKLDGVTISNVTCNNARFVKDMGLGSNAVVKIVRSGMVIPKIVKVLKPVEFQMPDVPNIDWNENGVELMTLTETDEQRFKQTVSFFEILEVDNVGEGVVKQLWEAGYDSVKAILELTPDKLSKLEGFGKRKAMIVYSSIQSKIKDVQLSKLQHATGFFKGLGSKKLLLLEHFETKPSVEEVVGIEGFAETSAQSYITSYDKFFDFIKELPVTIAKKVETIKVSNDLDGMTFVFTGVRRYDLELVIESRGGKIGSGVSKSTTHLVMKSVGSGSSKEKKAIELGVKIMTVSDLENLLK